MSARPLFFKPMKIDEHKIKALHKVSLFRDLSPKDIREVLPFIQEKTCPKGEVVFSVGESCRRIIIVYQGRVKIFKSSPSGKEQILEVLESGDTCACHPGSSEWSCSSSAQTLTKSVLWILDRTHYVKLVQSNSKLAAMLTEIFARRLCHFASLIESVSLDQPRDRLVKFLLDYHDNHQGLDDPMSIPLTHEEIAQRIGLARETVTRQLQALKKAGMIEIHPQRIAIPDPAALKCLINCSL